MNQPSSQHFPPTDVVEPPAAKGGRGWVVVVLLLLVVAAGGTWLYRSRQAAAAALAAKGTPDRPVPVVLSTVERKDVPIYLEGLGNALPTYTVTVHTQVNGPLVAVNFKEGQFVHKGDLLAQVDPRPYHRAPPNAEAALARDKASSRTRSSNLERYRELRQQKLIAQQQYTTQHALVDTTNGTIKTGPGADREREAQRRLLPHRLADRRRDRRPPHRPRQHRPRRATPTGSSSSPSSTRWPSSSRSRRTTSRACSSELAKGPITVEAYSRDGSHELATGTLTLIDNQVNETTATIRLQAIFPNPKSHPLAERVREGAPPPLDREGRDRRAGRHVQRGPKGTFAYVVGADNVAEMRLVDLLSPQGDAAIIAPVDPRPCRGGGKGARRRARTS